jgi:GxxExxY protein
MHPQFEKASALSETVIGAAIEVHRIMGPGLIESIYERCLSRELTLRGISVETQRSVPITYKGETFTEQLRFDMLVEKCLLVEVKAVEAILAVHKAQTISYLKLLQIPLGLLLNFHQETLVQGVSRLVLPGAGLPA